MFEILIVASVTLVGYLSAILWLVGLRLAVRRVARTVRMRWRHRRPAASPSRPPTRPAEHRSESDWARFDRPAYLRRAPRLAARTTGETAPSAQARSANAASPHPRRLSLDDERPPRA